PVTRGWRHSQWDALDLMELPDIDADAAVGIGRFEDIPELRAPDNFLSLVGRAGVHVLGERLIKAVEKDQKLRSAGAQLRFRDAPQRAGSIDRMHHGPGQRKEHYLLALELQRNELAIDVGNLSALPPSRQDAGPQLA